MKVGIDTLALYSSQYALMLETLAKARGIDPNKFQQGLGQYIMAVPPPGEDIITMACNAANIALRDIDSNQIEMLLFATESGIDYSKAAGIYVHHLLGLPEACRVVELKQACYAGTAGLQMALAYLQVNPDKKILLIASDIARYGLGTTGESSQGAGAVAMVLSANPRLIAFDKEYGVTTQHSMDFWRPNYLHEAVVDGKYSSKLYLTMLEKTFKQYAKITKRSYQDFAYICYHAPVPRLVEKADQYLQKINQMAMGDSTERVANTLHYSRQMGNSYTASLYICLASLLDHTQEDLTNKRIGFYSYGSGCVAEFFSGVIQPSYSKVLCSAYHQQLLAKRKILNYQQYAEFYTYPYNELGDTQIIPTYATGNYALVKLENHQRIYEKCSVEKIKPTIIFSNPTPAPTPQKQEKIFKVMAPGKLILSGEHAVVYGQPALAMAINRFVTATITQAEIGQQITFDFSNLSHQSVATRVALAALKDRIKNKYHCFMQGDFSIRRVLSKPFELAQYAFGLLSESLNINLPHGMTIKVESDLPIGCGLGSSAATIVSVMHALTTYLNMPLSRETFYKLALDVENMQHGKSSGLDLQLAMQGGCLLVENQIITPRQVPTTNMYLVNSGSPASTTGECVEKVAPLFKNSHLANQFGEVTRALDQAFQQQSMSAIRETLHENHRLLTAIGVVPNTVQHFVREIEEQGGAAKICGAGSVQGERAGAILVIADDEACVTTITQRYNYQLTPIAGELQGVHAA